MLRSIIDEVNMLLAIDCNVSTAPAPARDFWNGLDDHKPEEAWIISPVKESYSIENNVQVGSPEYLIRHLSNK